MKMQIIIGLGLFLAMVLVGGTVAQWGAEPPYDSRAEAIDLHGASSCAAPYNEGTLAPFAQPTAGNMYYVDQSHPQASDSNPGTEGAPWLTIQHAANVALAGDTVYVKAGSYPERVSTTHPGSAGNLITFRAVGSVVMRGFSLYNTPYIRIAGFEITGFPAGSTDPGIYLYAAHGSEIWDNVVHPVPSIGIRLHPPGPSNHVLIKGNTIAYCGYETGGSIGINVSGNNNLVEYNDVSHVNDYIRLFGDNNVVRNNYFHDSFWADFPGTAPHIDGFQHFGGTWYPLAIHGALLEANYMSTVPDGHTHYVMLEDGEGLGSTDIIFRRNVGHDLGSYVLIDEEVDNVRVFHNTLVDTHVAYSPKGWTCISFANEATGGKVINNIFYRTAREDGGLYDVDAPSQPGFYGDYNLAYQSGDPHETHGIIGSDPQFIDYAGDDFYLQDGSPAIDEGGFLTVADGSGARTSVSVADAGFFTDGWGVVEGDLIQVGGNDPARITAIDYGSNRITLDRSITWSDGDGVSLAYAGIAPDMGAYEGRDGESCQLDVTIIHPANGSAVDGIVVVQADVTNADCVRHVVFFVDGVPQKTVGEAPFVLEWDTSGLPLGSRHTIEARAYVRYASQDLVARDEVWVMKTLLRLVGRPANQAIYLDWSVGITLPVTSTWRFDYEGPAGDQPPPISGIVSPTRAYTLTGLTNYVWYTVTLDAMLDSTSLLSDTVCVMPTDIAIYLPLVWKTR